MPAKLAETLGPEHVSPLVAWLASVDSHEVTGRIFDVGGGRIGVVEAWRLGPEVNGQEPWDAAELGTVVPELVARSAPNVDMSGRAAPARQPRL